MKHTYVYASGKLLRETYGSNTFDFSYSTSGQPYALKHNGTTYYYITNLQVDVMTIVNDDGHAVTEYKFEPFRSIISAITEPQNTAIFAIIATSTTKKPDSIISSPAITTPELADSSMQMRMLPQGKAC